MMTNIFIRSLYSHSIYSLYTLLILYISATTSFTTSGSLMTPNYSLCSIKPLKQFVSQAPRAPLANRPRLFLKPNVAMALGSGDTTDGYLNNLNIQKYINANITSIIKKSNYYRKQDIPFAGDQINITSVYLNIDKVKGVYFAKDAKNVIFTLQDKLADLYYYDVRASGDAKASGDGRGIYKITNNTRINMKGLNRCVFQSFNNDVDGILF